MKFTRHILMPDTTAAPVQEPVAKPKLIGWRTADFLNETTDIKQARSWEVHYEVLPIFEGDPNTKLVTPPATPVKEPVAGQPLPCPFCGHIGLDFSDGETYRWGVASCGGCGASCGEVRREYPDKSEWHTEAISEWNRRSPAAQRQWVEIDQIKWDGDKLIAKLKEKNT
jgi:transcription elongation factor Elf1